jgi:hypothetical protein
MKTRDRKPSLDGSSLDGSSLDGSSLDGSSLEEAHGLNLQRTD